MTILAYITISFLIIRLIVSIVNLVTRQWLQPIYKLPANTESLVTENTGSMVSILIPVRNEEQNIPNLLPDLSAQDYKNIEIVVYDDQSVDRTPAIVREYADKDKRIRLITGENLPGDWLGKNYACHQLSLTANGKYLLFLDADVRVKSELISRSIAHMNRYKIGLMSIFPVQEMKTFGEKITVPVMNQVLTGLLPLILTRTSGKPSLSAANGQFMLFREDIYKKYLFHKLVRNSPVEDIDIFKLMKLYHQPAHTILSNGDIRCRMYSTWTGAIRGFSKNVLSFFGKNVLLAILYALVTTFGIFTVIISQSYQVTITFIMLLLIHKTIVSIISQQSIIENILYAPLQQFSLCIMVLKGIMYKRSGRLIWKGRNVYGPTNRNNVRNTSRNSSR